MGVSSGSVTMAEQVKVSSLYIVPVGVIDMLESVGTVLDIVMVAVPAVPLVIPSSGVTRTVHCSPLLVAEEGKVLVV